jgi:hypothetical protein
VVVIPGEGQGLAQLSQRLAAVMQGLVAMAAEVMRGGLEELDGLFQFMDRALQARMLVLADGLGHQLGRQRGSGEDDEQQDAGHGSLQTVGVVHDYNVVTALLSRGGFSSRGLVSERLRK